jgi:hypothetical protein
MSASPSKQEDQHASEMLRIERKQATFNGLLVVAAFIGVGVSAYQLSAMRDQNAEMIKQNSAAQDQLSAMSDQNEIAVLQLQQMAAESRPWIGVNSPKVVHPITAERVSISLNLTNYGKSPAFIDEVSGQFVSFPKDPPDGFRQPTVGDVIERLKRHAKRNTNAITIEPGETFPASISLDGPGEDKLARFFGDTSENVTLFYFRIRYRGAGMDVENETPLRCFKYDGKSKTLNAFANFNWDRIIEGEEKPQGANP